MLVSASPTSVWRERSPCGFGALGQHTVTSRMDITLPGQKVSPLLPQSKVTAACGWDRGVPECGQSRVLC